jgi:hypothetical protein
MPICPQCGVEIEEDEARCPLCGSEPEERSVEAENETARSSESRDGSGKAGRGARSAAGAEELPLEGGSIARHDRKVIEEHEAKLRLLLRDVFGFLALAGALVVFAVDFAYGTDITWSRFPLLALGYLVVVLYMPLYLPRLPGGKTYPLIIGETAATGLFLSLLNRFTAGPDWFLPLALPLTLLSGVLVLAVTTVIRRFRLSALGGISTALVAAGLFTVATELVLDSYLGAPPAPSWSLITAAAVIPIILFLINFERRLRRRGSDLKKYFHV